MKIPHVHTKKAKGHTYYYFDLGRDAGGKRILKRLPDPRNRQFGAALAAAKAQRTHGEKFNGIKTFDWLVKLYERSPEFQSKSENTKRQYSRHLAYANEQLRNRHGQSAPLSHLTAEQMVVIKDKFADEPGKVNAILKAVSAICAWGMRPGRRYLKENIAAGVEPLATGEHEAWPPWLVNDALDDPAVRLPVALLYFTGQRIGDAVKLGRGNITNGILSLKQQKTGKRLRIAVHKRLAEIIELDAPKDAMVFLLGDKGHPATDSGIRQRIQKWALSKHKLHVVPHGLRKSAVNALLEANCSIAEIAAITGQSLQMIEHYGKDRDGEQLSTSAILKFERGTGGERANGM